MGNYERELVENRDSLRCYVHVFVQKIVKMVTVSECDSSSGNENVYSGRASACLFKTFLRFTPCFTPITRKHETLPLETPKFTSFS